MRNESGLSMKNLDYLNKQNYANSQKLKDEPRTKFRGEEENIQNLISGGQPIETKKYSMINMQRHKSQLSKPMHIQEEYSGLPQINHQRVSSMVTLPENKYNSETKNYVKVNMRKVIFKENLKA